MKNNLPIYQLKRFLKFFCFNLFLACLVITFFYLELDLNPLVIPVHIFFTLYYLVSLFLILFLINKFFNAKFFSLLLLILYQYSFLIFYSSYYFGKEKVGFPFTVHVIYPYLKEIRNPFNFEYISSEKIIFLIFLFILLTFLQARYFKNVYLEFKLINKSSLKLKKYFNALLLIMLMIPIISNNLNSKSKTSIKNNEPSLSFFSATINLEGRLSGVENIKIKEEYPSNLDFEKKNVILIVCDAFRSDYIGVYGSGKKLTPFLDSLVTSESLLKIDNYFSTTSWSYNGILNTLSSSHELYNNNFFIHDALKKQGYDVRLYLTGDFSNFVGLGKLIKTDSADEYFDGFIARKENKNVRMNDDNSVVLSKLRTLENYNNTPSFFYLHFMTAHELGIFKNKTEAKVDLLSMSQDKIKLKKDYILRVRQLDEYLKEAFNILKKKRYLDNSIIVITSDHGQSLGERDKYFHSQSTYYNEIKIPLFVSNNPGKTHIKKNNLISNQLDIGPTIFNLLGIPNPKNWKGESIFLEKRENRPLFQHQRNYYSVIWTQKNRIYQYIYNKKKTTDELFDITDKSQLNKNLASSFSKIKLDSVKNLLFRFYDIAQ